MFALDFVALLMRDKFGTACASFRFASNDR
jgi:hypothetical protein